MKRRQKAGFLGPISSNHTKEGKEKEKRKSEEEGGVEGVEDKKAMVALLVLIMATLEIDILPKKKNCWTEKIHLAVMFSNSA